MSDEQTTPEPNYGAIDPRLKVCPDCHGTCYEDEGTCGYRGTCRTCGGSGKVKAD